MAKLSKRKRQRLEASKLARSYAGDTEEADEESSSASQPLHPPSTATLSYLNAVASASPAIYFSPSYKTLRRAIFPFVKLSLSKYILPDYAALTTTLLTPPCSPHGYEQAVLYLTAIRDLQVKVKQGTIQVSEGGGKRSDRLCQEIHDHVKRVMTTSRERR